MSDVTAQGSTEPGRIIVFAGSARRDSFNKHLARIATSRLIERGRSAVFVDLADFEMPLYHGDIEAEHGVPEAAHRLAEVFSTAQGFLIASPEYNGAMTALLKNTVDWVTRIDMGVFRSKFIGLMAASPGRGGGARSLSIVRQWLQSMRLAIADAQLAIPQAHESLHVDGDTSTLDATAIALLDDFLETYLVEFDHFLAASLLESASPSG